MKLLVKKHKLRNGGSAMIFLPQRQEGLSKEHLVPIKLSVGQVIEVDDILAGQILQAYPGCVVPDTGKSQERKAVKADKQAVMGTKEVK